MYTYFENVSFFWFLHLTDDSDRTYLSPSSAELRYMWSYNSIPPILHSMDIEKFASVRTKRFKVKTHNLA